MSQLVTADPTASLNTVKLKPSDIKRVKAKGCLIDKRTGRDFNVRVITRNGKNPYKRWHVSLCWALVLVVTMTVHDLGYKVFLMKTSML